MAQTRVIIDLDAELAAGLEAAAKQAQTSVESFAAKAVAGAIADVAAWAEDDAAYAEYERTGEAIPIAAVEQWVRAGAQRANCRRPHGANRLPEPR
jgi:hypothetical protein